MALRPTHPDHRPCVTVWRACRRQEPRRAPETSRDSFSDPTRYFKAPPFYKDVVDVFEDRMLNWLLLPAKDLLKRLLETHQ